MMNVAIIILDEKGKIVYWSNSAERMFGYSRAEAMGRELREILFPAASRVDFENKYETFRMSASPREGKIDLELIAEKKDGAETEFRFSLFLIEIGGLRLTIVIARNYLGTLQASLPSQIPIPMIELDYRMDINYQNPSACSIFPDLEEKKSDHPLLKEIEKIIEESRMKEISEFTREIECNHKHYEEKIYLIPESDFIRIFVLKIPEPKTVAEIEEEPKYIDELTGLYNRRGFEVIADQQIKLSERIKRGFILFVFKIRNLEAVADVFGPRTKKKVIVEFGSNLKEVFRKTDIAAHLDEDCFAAIAIGAKKGTAQIMIDRLQDKLDFINLDIRNGYAYYDPFDPCTFDDLYKRAQLSLGQ